jgi:hypothetical protein
MSTNSLPRRMKTGARLYGEQAQRRCSRNARRNRINAPFRARVRAHAWSCVHGDHLAVAEVRVGTGVEVPRSAGVAVADTADGKRSESPDVQVGSSLRTPHATAEWFRRYLT